MPKIERLILPASTQNKSPRDFRRSNKRNRKTSRNHEESLRKSPLNQEPFRGCIDYKEGTLTSNFNDDFGAEPYQSPLSITDSSEKKAGVPNTVHGLGIVNTLHPESNKQFDVSPEQSSLMAQPDLPVSSSEQLEPRKPPRHEGVDVAAEYRENVLKAFRDSPYVDADQLNAIAQVNDTFNQNSVKPTCLINGSHSAYPQYMIGSMRTVGACSSQDSTQRLDQEPEINPDFYDRTVEELEYNIYAQGSHSSLTSVQERSLALTVKILRLEIKGFQQWASKTDEILDLFEKQLGTSAF